MQYFGREASAFTKAALEGKTVLLQKDRTGDTVDRYGRWLRYVLLDGDNFNARLIRDGYAHAYRRFPFSKRTEFIQLEEQARRRGIGLWNRRALLHDSTAARVGALFQLLVQDTTAQDFGLPSSAIRLRM